MSVPWERLYHAYGRAEDVPERLRALRDNDPEIRRKALSDLWGSVCHQNTRWQASAYVVPFLVGLVEDSATPDRARILDLIRGLALGGMRDDSLPFDPDKEFADGAGVTGEEDAEVVRRVFEEQDDTAADDDEFMELADRVTVRWAADAYHAVAEHVDRYRVWLGDPDDEVAAQSAELLAWFAPTGATVDALLAIPAERVGVRASANLTLAHLSDGRADVDAYLMMLLESKNDLTAAIALAFRNGERVPDRALTRLVEATEFPDGFPGWDRAPRGFVALSLQRVGLQ